MQVGEINIKWLVFPGRAGELQRVGAIGALVRELGSNYGVYHVFLATALDRLPPRPGPAEMAKGMDVFLEAWDHVNDVIFGEVLLRACRSYVADGRPLTAALDGSQPLVDANHRLVSAETGKPLAGVVPRPEAQRWSDPEMQLPGISQ
jgi:hypothetical protein